MPRIPYIDEHDHPELAPLVARIKAERGKVLDLYKILLHSPAVRGDAGASPGLRPAR